MGLCLREDLLRNGPVPPVILIYGGAF